MAAGRGQEVFARYAFPPNELGHCGPGGTAQGELGSHAREFDGAWPYLQAIADAAGVADPLDADVVSGYWVGGPLLTKVEPAALVRRLRSVFTGQFTGLLDTLPDCAQALAHHSFHVFVVYPWVRFLDRDPDTAVRVLQDCRIRWGAVESVDAEHVTIASRPLLFDAGALGLGPITTERVRWRRADLSLTGTPPAPGALVTAHWDWLCGWLTEAEADALDAATRATLELVNTTRSREQTHNHLDTP
jgi:uncharacterized protein DUF6390